MNKSKSYNRKSSDCIWSWSNYNATWRTSRIDGWAFVAWMGRLIDNLDVKCTEFPV